MSDDVVHHHLKLCYVEGPWAWFTTNELSKQWGDDWNDAPYEHNAGWPYEWQPYMSDKDGAPSYELYRVAWDGPFSTPGEIELWGNSRYSVQIINTGAVAWLTDLRIDADKPRHIFAGIGVDEFISIVTAAGGNVYVSQTSVLMDTK